MQGPSYNLKLVTQISALVRAAPGRRPRKGHGGHFVLQKVPILLITLLEELEGGCIHVKPQQLALRMCTH